ncbi:hypothetical protein TIFTF001_021788 [Ficus carica]|uniref:Uncharacterized protein n=1 Tax=Ficus carica TaxID=3494 RepID=A0AA88DEY3_FICCA|nr:hypothetical protein TIFTF001_021788 [Ficus carica]
MLSSLKVRERGGGFRRRFGREEGSQAVQGSWFSLEVGVVLQVVGLTGEVHKLGAARGERGDDGWFRHRFVQVREGGRWVLPEVQGGWFWSKVGAVLQVWPAGVVEVKVHYNYHIKQHLNSTHLTVYKISHTSRVSK